MKCVRCGFETNSNYHICTECQRAETRKAVAAIGAVSPSEITRMLDKYLSEVGR